MRRRAAVVVFSLALLAVTGHSAEASGLLGGCFSGFHGGYCAPRPVQYQAVEYTVNVPEWVTEMRKVMVTECVPQVQDRKVVTYRRIPETKDVVREVTVMVPKTEMRQYKVVVCKPVYIDQEQVFTVMRNFPEERTATRRVCDWQQVKEKRMVTVDEGAWADKVVTVQCAPRTRGCGFGGCFSGLFGCFSRGCATGCAPVCAEPVTVSYTCRVWAPKLVQKEVEVTVMKPTHRDEVVKFTVNVCKPVQEKRIVKVYKPEMVEEVRTAPYTICVPEKRVITEKVTTCRTEAVESIVKVTVMVPRQVEKEVPFRTCRYVQKKMVRYVPVCCP